MPAALIALNLFLVRNFLTGEYFEIARQSIEGAFIALARWYAGGRSPFGWLPEWYCGNPFRFSYPPLLHYWIGKSVAILPGVSPAHHYHFWTGVFYSLGPVTAYWLLVRLTGRRWVAFLTSAGYSFLCPAAVVNTMGSGSAGVVVPFRFEAMYAYGEGPHTAALTLLPVALLLLLGYLERGAFHRLFVAALALAAVPLTNWLGGFALLLTATTLVAVRLAAGGRETLRRAAAAAGFAYLLAAFWITPEFAYLQGRNSSILSGTTYGLFQAATVAGYAAACVVIVLWLGKKPGGWRLAWLLMWCLGFALLVFARPLWEKDLLTNGERYVPELELGLWLLAAETGIRLWRRGPATRVACLAVILGFLVPGAWASRQFFWTPPGWPERLNRLGDTPEYRVADWLGRHAAHSRVFLRGGYLFWLSAWTNVQAVDGGASQGLVNKLLFGASYGITWSEKPATAKDRERARLWLDALGADYVVVSKPESREIYHDFIDPDKFDSWEKVYDSGAGEVIYRVPRRNPGIVQVIADPGPCAGRGAGEPGLAELAACTGTFRSFDRERPALTWQDNTRLEVNASTRAEEVVLLQVTHHPSWRAFEGLRELPVERTAVGHMVVRPAGPGHHRILLEFRSLAGERFGRWVSVLALAGGMGLAAADRIRRRGAGKRPGTRPAVFQ